MNNVVQQWTLKCSDERYAYDVHNLLKDLCNVDYELEILSSTRVKRLFNGRCCWLAHYKLINGNINGKQAFLQSVEKLTKNIPFGSKVVFVGRYGGSTHGVVVQYGKIGCICPSDFDYELTLIHLMELSTFTPMKYKASYNLIEMYSNLEILSGKFDSNLLIVADGNPSVNCFVREDFILNLAHIALILKVKKIVLIVNEIEDFKFLNTKRFMNIKTKTCNYFNSVKINCKEFTFIHLCMRNEEFEKQRPSLKDSKYKKISSLATITFTNSWDKKIFSIGTCLLD